MTTLTEAETMLSIVNAAISEYIQGKRRKALKVGTNEFLRAYDYVALTWEELIGEKNRLEKLMEDLTPGTVTPTFRKNTSFPLVVTRRPV